MKKAKQHNLFTKSLVGLCLIMLLGTLTLVFSDEYVAPSDDPTHNADKIFYNDGVEKYSIQNLYDNKTLALFIKATCQDQIVLTQKQKDINKSYQTNYSYGSFSNNHSLINCLKVRP